MLKAENEHCASVRNPFHIRLPEMDQRLGHNEPIREASVKAQQIICHHVRGDTGGKAGYSYHSRIHLHNNQLFFKSAILSIYQRKDLVLRTSGPKTHYFSQHLLFFLLPVMRTSFSMLPNAQKTKVQVWFTLSLLNYFNCD